MDEYVSNSRRSRQEEKETSKTQERPKAKKVVKGKVVVEQKSGFMGFVGSMIKDNFHDVKDHFIYDVMIPNINRGIKDSIDIAFGMEPSSRRNSSRRRERISYSSYYDEQADRRYRKRGDREYRSDSSSSYEYENVKIESKGEADDVLEAMADRMQDGDDGWCTVADLCDMLEITPSSTAKYFGWDSMDRMRVERRFDGWYKLSLPRPIRISERR